MRLIGLIQLLRTTGDRWRAGECSLAGVDPVGPRGMQIAGRWRDAANAWHALGSPLEEAQALLEGDAAARAQAKDILQRLGACGWLARCGRR